MKNKTFCLMAAAVIAAITSYTAANAASLDRMDPPFWYVGMEDPELQVMFYGPAIAETVFSLQPYDGVTVRSVEKTANPNYLFVYLSLAPQTRPGTLTFTFKDGRRSLKKTFELKPRNTKKGALGFNSGDVLYLIMPDRFANGNPANDDYEGFLADRKNGGAHHGGDLQGITDHLDYIDYLGVTAIWLNPVQYNKGNASHGYSISDYYLIDPRLGSNEEYCNMIDAAHSKDIKVVMDMIFNHCGSSHWWIEDVPDKDWFNQNDYAVSLGERMKSQSGGEYRPGGFQGQPRGREPQMNLPATVEEFEALSKEDQDLLVARYGGGRRDGDLVTTTHYKWTLMDPHAPQSEKDILLDGWFSGGMPDLNQRNPHLAKYLIQNSIWWIEYARIDGIRMDTYPYADYDFMVRWCNAIHTQYPDFNIVGEGWYPRNSAAGWWQRDSKVNEKNTQLQTVMDFDLTFTTQKEILNESNMKEGAEAGLFKMYECVTQDFLIPERDNILTFLDNHDISRFMQEGDPLWKFKQGIAFLLTTRGTPQIYYGTEIAMSGDKNKGGDSQVRADFPGGWAQDTADAFTKEGRTEFQNQCWDFISKVLNWRRTSNPVKNGKLIHYTPDNNTKCYVYARTDGDETVLVIINGSDTMRILDMARFSEVTGDNTKGTDVVTSKVIDLTSPVKIDARGVYILELSK